MFTFKFVEGLCLYFQHVFPIMFCAPPTSENFCLPTAHQNMILVFFFRLQNFTTILKQKIMSVQANSKRTAVFLLRCEICKIWLGKFVVTFSKLRRANFSDFSGFGKSCTELGNYSILENRRDCGIFENVGEIGAET